MIFQVFCSDKECVPEDVQQMILWNYSAVNTHTPRALSQLLFPCYCHHCPSFRPLIITPWPSQAVFLYGLLLSATFHRRTRPRNYMANLVHCRPDRRKIVFIDQIPVSRGYSVYFKTYDRTELSF